MGRLETFYHWNLWAWRWRVYCKLRALYSGAGAGALGKGNLASLCWHLVGARAHSCSVFRPTGSGAFWGFSEENNIWLVNFSSELVGSRSWWCIQMSCVSTLTSHISHWLRLIIQEIDTQRLAGTAKAPVTTETDSEVELWEPAQQAAGRGRCGAGPILVIFRGPPSPKQI